MSGKLMRAKGGIGRQVQLHPAVMELFVQETSLLRTDHLGICTPTPIQTAFAIRNFFQNLAITNKKS